MASQVSLLWRLAYIESKVTSLSFILLSAWSKLVIWKQLPRLKRTLLALEIQPLQPSQPEFLKGTVISATIYKSLISAREEGATTAASTKWVKMMQLPTDALSLLSSCSLRGRTAVNQSSFTLQCLQASFIVWKRSLIRKRRLASFFGFEVAFSNKFISYTKRDEFKKCSLKKLTTASLLPCFFCKLLFNLEYSSFILLKLSSSSLGSLEKYFRQSSLACQLEVVGSVRALMLACSLFIGYTYCGQKNSREVRYQFSQTFTTFMTSLQLKQAFFILGKSLIRLLARVLFPQNSIALYILSLSWINLYSSSLREAAQMSLSFLPAGFHVST